MGLQKINELTVFTTKDLDLTGANIRIGYGKRNNGKTMNTLLTICDSIFENGGKFVYLRRKHSHIVSSKMRELFAVINSKYYDSKSKTIDFSTFKGGFYLVDSGEHIGYAISLEDAYNNKSNLNFVGVKYIFFDEFLDYSYYTDEIQRFLHTIASIRRGNNSIVLYMMSNTILSNNPYFDLFKIDSNKIKRGELAQLYHKRGASIAVEYVESNTKYGAGNDSLLGFDSESVDMILYGTWEVMPCNTKPVDGISWKNKRKLLPFYLTKSGAVFEFSITLNRFPVLFIRTVNTQGGKVTTSIKYNITEDGKQLINKNGLVPTFTDIDFVDDKTLNEIKVIKKCLRNGRVIFDTNKTGTLIFNSKVFGHTH